MRQYLFVRATNIDDLADGDVDWVLTNSKGKIIDLPGASVSIDQIVNNENITTKLVIIIPDNLVSYYLVDIPLRDTKKQLQAIPYILEERIVSDIEDTHFVIGPEFSTNRYIVAVTNKQKIVNLLSTLLVNYNVTPKYILTDAICLYKNTLDTNKEHSHGVYLNKPDNIALVLNNNIVVSDLNNVDLILEQKILESKGNANGFLDVDFFKYKLDNVKDYCVNSLSKVSIGSEQVIKQWLPFLVDTWFRNSNSKTNKNRGRNKFNLAHGLIKPVRFDIVFDPLWKKTAAIFAVALTLVIGYKYLDYKIYTNYNQEIEGLIKSEFESMELNNSNLKLVGKLLDKTMLDISKDITSEQEKNIFYVLLSEFAEGYNNYLIIKEIIYNYNKLEIIFDINKSNINKLDKIKDKIKNSKINLDENVAEQFDNDIGITLKVNWSLSLNEPVVLLKNII